MVLLNVQCKYPEAYSIKGRCCICGGFSKECPCTSQLAVNHFMQCHIEDPCGYNGHLTVAKMITIGMPAPTVPCRNCRQNIIVQFI